MCLPKILFPEFMSALIFPLPLILTWPLIFLIFSPPLWNFHVFLLTEFVLPSSFSVIYVSLNIKNNVEKDTTLLLLFSLWKSRRPCGFLPLHLGCHTCWLTNLVPGALFPGFGGEEPGKSALGTRLLIELFVIGVPVVRTDGHPVARCTVTWLLDCKTVRIFAYSATQEQPNKRSGTRLKTESQTGERR